MKTTQLQIRSSAFYRNSLTLKREQQDETATAQGYYATRYGSVHLYGENYGKASGRKPLFGFDFTYEGRNYACTFYEWLSDAAIRLRANRFVAECLKMAKA